MYIEEHMTHFQVKCIELFDAPVLRLFILMDSIHSALMIVWTNGWTNGGITDIWDAMTSSWRHCNALRLKTWTKI